MGPLEGIRVLDLSIGQMGPAATAMLADMGARVVKVESRHGDPGRGVEIQAGGVSYFFLTHNRGKKSAVLNLRHAEGKEAALRLAAQSDVFVQSWTPGTVDRLGLDYQAVSERNPSIIYASASGFGPAGPRAGLPAMDMVAQGAGGLMMANAGYGDAEPVAVGPTIADQTGGLLLAWGIVTALFHRERTGRGQRIDASLLGGMIALQGWHITHFLATGKMAMTSSRRKERSPLFTFYRARDGWFTIAIIDPRQWPVLCRVAGRLDLEDDPRFRDAAGRNQHAAELIAILDARFAEQPREHWLNLLMSGEIPCGSISSYADLAEDEQVAANGYLVSVNQPGLGEMRLPGPPVGFNDSPAEIRPAPELGQHTEEVLRGLGYSWDDIQELREKHTIL